VSASGVAARAVESLVTRACRYPRAIVAAVLVLSCAASFYVVTNISVHTEIAALIPPETPWRRDAAALEQAFAEEGDDITVVIDAQTPELAEAAAARLTTALGSRRDLFRSVKRSGAGPFFAREGLLYMPQAEVERTTEALIAAQPLLAPLTTDPSLRGIMTSLASAATSVAEGQADPSRLAKPVAALVATAAEVEGGRPSFFAWQPLITGQAAEPSDLRQFIEILPRLDGAQASSGAAPVRAVRAFARALQLSPENGVRVRVTGSTAIDVDELATLQEATGPLGVVSVLMMVGVLYSAVRSARMLCAIMLTVFCGLAITAAAGLALERQFSLLSVAFMPLFVGLGVDFAIQFCVRYRAELISHEAPRVALVRAARGVGGGLTLAAATIATGFFAFVPTQYQGVAELGTIAGIGMIVAFAASVTFLPALLVLLRARSAGVHSGLAVLRRADALVDRRWRLMLGAGVLLGVAALSLAPLLKLNFDPMRLRDPRAESVATFRDLARDPQTSPDALDAVSPDLASAQRTSARLAVLPQVREAITVASFIPSDQEKKLAVIRDAADLLGPTLDPFDVATSPTDADLVASLHAAATALHGLSGKPAAGQVDRLAGLLEAAAAGPPEVRAKLQRVLISGLPVALNQARAMLRAEPVTLTSLPRDLREDWLTNDGRARVQAYPKAAPDDQAGQEAFVAAVRAVLPHAVGTPIATLETRRLILRAFGEAGTLALAAITLLLFATFRNWWEVGLTLTPVLLSAVLTTGLCVLLGQDLNLENLVALPLLLGVGVSFNIYFVIAQREGLEGSLGSSLTRAILFSALATGVAFGALGLSAHPGTASMGRLMLISLGCTLVTTLGLQPAAFRALRRGRTFSALELRPRRDA